MEKLEKSIKIVNWILAIALFITVILMLWNPTFYKAKVMITILLLMFGAFLVKTNLTDDDDTDDYDQGTTTQPKTCGKCDKGVLNTDFSYQYEECPCVKPQPPATFRLKPTTYL